MFLEPTAADVGRRGLAPLALLALVFAGCEATTLTVEPGAAPAAESPTAAEPPVYSNALVPSRKARVKFKGGQRYATDLAAALEVPRSALCNELGQFDCVETVHRIALGGVDPYVKGVLEPLATSPVTAAIAVDRVALSACAVRVDADFAEPEAAVLFGALAGAEPGSTPPEVLKTTAADLVDRLLRRDATPDEIAALIELHDTVLAEGVEAPRQVWARLGCFSVATMLEALFY